MWVKLLHHLYYTFLNFLLYRNEYSHTPSFIHTFLKRTYILITVQDPSVFAHMLYWGGWTAGGPVITPVSHLEPLCRRQQELTRNPQVCHFHYRYSLNTSYGSSFRDYHTGQYKRTLKYSSSGVLRPSARGPPQKRDDSSQQVIPLIINMSISC